MSKPYWFEDSYTVALSVAEMYERNRGTEQPVLSNYNVVSDTGDSPPTNNYGNGLPWFNPNNWEFGLNEDTCYNRWMDLIDGAGAAVSAGGALTFYELSFETSGVNAMDFKLRKSGDNTTINTVKNSVATGVKVGEQEGMESNPTGTQVQAWGSNYHGSLPVENSKYWSGVIKFQLRPNWSSAAAYEVDAIVKVDSTSETIAPTHYKCISAHTNQQPPNATYWSVVDMSDEFGDTVQYSPWTDDKARLWSNAGANPDRATFSAGGWFDINTVVNDEKFFRTWVDARVTTTNTNTDLDTLAATYSYDGTRDGFPRGFRVLVTATGTLTGDLANFQNQVAEIVSLNSVGTARAWKKVYNFNQESDGVHVANLDDGKIYQDTVGGTAASPTHSWSAIDTDKYGNDCFHPWSTAPANSEGVDKIPNPSAGKANIARADSTDSTRRPDVTKDGSTFSTNNDSAITFVSQVNIPAQTLQNATDTASAPTDPWQRSTVGFNLRFPYPNNTEGGIAENVGELYGGGASEGDWSGSSVSYTAGQTVHNNTALYICINNHTSGASTEPGTGANWTDEWRKLTGFEPSTLDVQNMHFTHDGQDGFNCLNSAAEDYGQISAISMWLYYSQTNIFTGELDDEHKFRAWAIDTRDNVVYQDFVIRFSEHWEEIRLPISGFRPYRGRKPLTAIEAALSDFKPAKEMEMINIFEWRNIKLFGVQYQSQYDEFGRFNPAAATLDSAGTAVTWANLLPLGTTVTRTLIMDGFHFVKPLLAVSGSVTDRNIEPDFQQFPNIEIYDQLVNAAKSQLEIEKFQHKEFNIDSTGDEIFDVRFGDSFYLENDNLVNNSDNGSNNIKLVAKRIEYSITKPPQGRGGLRRKINGAKIFT